MATDEAPPFWWQRPGWQALALSPLGWVYGRATARRMASRPAASVPVPVLCVGNFIAGGAGKTPTVLALARAVSEFGLKPGILSRGYGGGIAAPTIVEPGTHNVHDVGDEPLMLAEKFMTVVSVDRALGAEMLVANGCEFIIMDDGFQNPHLARDYCLVVVDDRRAVGNGFCIPAGPLRALVRDQMPYADAILIIGSGSNAGNVIRMAARAGKPAFHARTVAINGKRLKGRKLLAFAGIADPEKFFVTLEALGGNLVERRSFGDHHVYLDDEIDELIDVARDRKLTLVTTTKDMARLQNSGAGHKKLAEAANALAIRLKFEERRISRRIIEAAVAKAQRRFVSEG